MDTQTTEALKEISERYELYKDIVKIGLGALIGASGSLITVFLKNKHELKKLEKESEYQSNKHKLEIKVRILEEVILLVDEFSNQDYTFRNFIWKLRFYDKYFKEIDNVKREKLLSNVDAYVSSINGIQSARRKLDMIGAESISQILDELRKKSLQQRNEILNSELKISFTNEEWKERYQDISNLHDELRKKLNNFFIELK